MSLKKYNHHQQGVALIFAIVIAIVLFLMGFMLFALSGSLLRLDKSRKNYLENRISVHQMFRDAVANNSFQYTQNIVPGVSSGSSNFTSGTYDFEITNNHIDDNANQRFNSFIVPENGYTMRTIDYYLSLNSGNNQRDISIRVPSNTQRSRGAALNKSTIALNIPAVNVKTLSNTQKSSGSSDFEDTGVGYVGDLTIDNSNYTLAFTDTNGNNSSALSLPNGFDSGNFALSQGWVLENGSWQLSIGVYSTDGTQACVIEAPLTDVLADISALECVSLEEDEEEDIEGIRYPNPETFPICVEGENYSQGDICSEDGILFEANASATGLPFTNSTNWRIYYPNNQWISPYTQGGIYDIGDLVVYDGIVFRVTQNEETQDPYDGGSWEVGSGIYEFNENIDKYPAGSVVLYQQDFYRKKNNSSKKEPSRTQHWDNLGPTLEQEEIDQLSPELQVILNAGMTALDLTPAQIIFPYRNQNPTQEYLNCQGEYPPIDTSVFEQCIDGEVYNTGDICYENNQLFEAQWWISQSPFNIPNNSKAWLLSIPDSNVTGLDWVVPYSNNVSYNTGTKVIFDGRRFVTTRKTSKTNNPYDGDDKDAWKIDGIYEWSNQVRYLENDVVIRDGNFYRNRQNGQFGNDPLDVNSPDWDEWENLGPTYNGQTIEEVLNSCGPPSTEAAEANTVIPFDLADNLSVYTGNSITASILDLPNNFKLYGDSNPTSVHYSLSGSLFNQISSISVTDEQGWKSIPNPSSEGDTLVRNWNGNDITILFDANGLPKGTYNLDVVLQYTIDGQTYSGSKSYSVNVKKNGKVQL
ncbi:hypothetical protein [Francisella uliginis]|uniref:Chitin-binding type-3 domain-containing protein n=1 Tax=Francisella uliginis TaxID=573570 RepID=A0A1L4BQN7_9GAMM|nr:hypothetical protein [Francisella uliginis]API86161.1 hypothetical protein F7310_01795 [Francisella uliginis]